MNRISLTIFLLALFGLMAFWGMNQVTAPAIAAADDKHAGHDHAQEPAGSHNDDDLEDLFGDDEEDHAGHDHARKPSGQSGHEGHGHGPHEGIICDEHNVPEAVCALCQGTHLGDLQPGQGMKVRLAGPEVAAKAGVHLTRPQTVTLAAGVNIPGQAAFNRQQLAYITPLASGVIRKVHVQPGSRVAAGAALVEIAMPEVAALKAEYRAARAHRTQAEASFLREKDLLERGISSRREFQQAEADYAASRSAVEQYRQQLLNFGLTETDLKQLQQSGDASARITLRAPFAGVVTDIQTALGEAVAEGSALLTVADLETLWIELAIPESQIYRATVGTAIQARFAGLPGAVYSGRLFQVGASVDARTRSLPALAEVDNPGHRLKVGMYGEVQLLSGTESGRLAIPAEAIQSIDGAPFVFIQEEPDLFEIRRVTTGPSQDGLVVVSTGLAAADQVVAGQGFALKSEVLKARLGASCADH